ncbi:MAG TPA: YwiC-like family protein [Anaeromyxobacter sp.]
MRSLSESPSPAPAPAPREEPSLLPREHGAWGQLAMPLVTGLALGRPGAAALLLVAGIVLAFLAHEPLLVVLGHRGRRVKDVLGSRATRRLAALGAAAAVCGVAALVLSPPAARLAALAPAALALPVAPLVARRLEKTTAGELLVAAALSACAAPVALAAGAPAAWAWGSVATWFASFAAATLPVRATLLWARTRGARELRPLAAAGAGAIGGAALLGAAGGLLPWPAALGVLPTALAAALVALLRIRPQRFTTVGWSLVGASVATLLVLVVGFRAG